MAALSLRASARRVSLLSSPQRVFWTPWTQQTLEPCLAVCGLRAASTAKAQRTRTATKKEKDEAPAKPARKRKTIKTVETAETVEKSEKPASKATAKAKTVKKPKDALEPDSLIPPLSLSQLRDVAVLCGRNSSGTKAVLRADLEEAVLGEAAQAVRGTPRPARTRPPQRILSIDMGVRNLAYCLLEVDAATAAAAARGRAAPARLVAWERLSLIDEDDARQASAAAAAATATLFTPPRLAAVAARLVRDRLLALQPTHILIERQRSRSGGGMAVLEWTMRVNSLEAMLHGILAYHQVSGTPPAVQDVEAVSPKRVSVFLLRGGIGDGTRRESCPPAATSKEKDIKDVKEAFIAGALRAPPKEKEKLLAYDGAAGDMVAAYLLRWDAKQRRSQPKPKTKTKTKTKTPKTAAGQGDAGTAPDGGTAQALPLLSKIDDLADCVAQGLIWLEWERNKDILRAKGAQPLLEEKQLPG